MGWDSDMPPITAPGGQGPCKAARGGARLTPSRRSVQLSGKKESGTYAAQRLADHHLLALGGGKIHAGAPADGMGPEPAVLGLGHHPPAAAGRGGRAALSLHRPRRV